MEQSIWAIILAAGGGTRTGLSDKNKVTLEVNGKPLITQTIQNLKSAGIENIVVVVGQYKESVLALLDESIKTIEQNQQLGTAHAVQTGMKVISSNTKNILVVHGDDSYNLPRASLQQLIDIHIKHQNQMTFLTADLEDPIGIGRVIRNNQGNLIDLIEEQDATEQQKQVKEANIACYLFNKDFLNEYLAKVNESSSTGELYLTQLIKLGINDGKKIEALKINHPNWQGINTMKDLQKAEESVD